METKIRLRTHDGSNNYLQLLEDRPNTYKLVTQFNFIRGGKVSNGQDFIDPSGGPMLVVGDKIEGTDYVIESIEFEKGIGHIIKVK